MSVIATTKSSGSDAAMIRLPARGEDGWHSIVWLAWVASAAFSLQLASSPLYVGLVIAIAWVMVSAFGRGELMARAFGFIVAMAGVLALFRVALAGLTVRGGGDVLFMTPSITLPRIFGGYSVGGGVDAGVVLDAAGQALMIVGVVAVFAAFNAVVSYHELVAAMPRAFFELGIVVTVGLTFVPATIAAIGDVREADRARAGGRPPRRRRLLRMLIPVLETGLERAIALSESMDSRGFARVSEGGAGQASVWLAISALVAWCGAFGALVSSRVLIAGIAGGAGLVALAGAVWLASRSAPARYRRRRAALRDWIAVSVMVIPPLGVGIASVVGDATLRWPEATLGFPALAPVPALSLAFLLLPLVGASRRDSPDEVAQ